MPWKCGAAGALLRLVLNSGVEISAQMVSSSRQPQLPMRKNPPALALRRFEQVCFIRSETWNATPPSPEALGGTERKDGYGRIRKRREINPWSPLAHLLCVSTGCWLSGGAGVRGSPGRRGAQMLPRPPPTSMEMAGPNICSHLYKTAVCLAVRSLLCDPGKPLM